MIAIRVRYMPATATRQARWQATDGHHYLYAPIQYENEEQEKLQLANQFKLKFLPHSPELNPTPAQFNGHDYFTFYPKQDSEKLEELLSQYCAMYRIDNNLTIELIRMFVKQNCILKENTV